MTRFLPSKGWEDGEAIAQNEGVQGELDPCGFGKEGSVGETQVLRLSRSISGWRYLGLEL